MDITEAHKQYENAVAEERSRWEKVKGRHPGQEGHQAHEWAMWLAAAERVRRLARLIQQMER